MNLLQLAFVFFLASAGFEFGLGWNPQTKAANQQSSPSADSEEARFTLIRLSDGTFEGTYGTMKTYKAADGELVWLVLRHFKSREDAKKLFEARVHKALAVIKQDDTLDSSGTSNAQTAVLKAAAKESDKALTEIVTLSGGEFRDVLSSSASDAAALAALAKP